MKNIFRKTMIVAALTMYATGAQADSWQSSTSKNPQGYNSGSMWVTKHEFALVFECDARDGPKNKLGVKFHGPALPRLYGKDGDTAKLSLLFTLRGGVLVRDAWEPYFFDGGPGDQAWLGSIRAGETELNALSRALKLDILNKDGDLVYTFGTKGTSKAVAKLRQACKFPSAPSNSYKPQRASAPAKPQQAVASVATSPKQLKAKSEAKPLTGTPKPTDHIAREQEPKALTPAQFKLHAGWPEKIAGYKISTPQNMKFAIIDSGFAGAEEFITNTPSLHGRVRHYKLGKKNKKGRKTSNHGTSVLKVANEVMPAGQIYLIDISNTFGKGVEMAIQKMNELGVHYGTMSLGRMGRYGRHNFDDKLPKFVQMLEETQTTLFVSAGNYRDTIHIADFADRDQNGILELWPETAEVKDHETLWFGISKQAKAYLNFAWDVPKNPTGEVIIKILDGKNKIEKRFPVKKGRGFFRFKRINKPKLALQIGVEGLTEPFGGIRVRKNLMFDAGPAWNGLRSSGDYAIWDSPFLIPVGSVGEDRGHLVPSVFSSIDKSNKGKTMPLVLGPGQIKVGKEAFEGTSFATPFIAALYAPFSTHNISNVIEHTSGFEAIGKGFSELELGRWGIPIAQKILGSNHCTKDKYQLHNLQSVDEKLSVELQFSLNCMEKIKYAIVMTLETEGADPKTGRRGIVTNMIDGKERPLKVTQQDISNQRDIVDKKIFFEADLKNLSPRFRGLKVLPKFQIYTYMDQSGLILHASKEAITLN